MSLAILQDPATKKWLNGRCNSLQIDNGLNLQYLGNSSYLKTVNGEVEATTGSPLPPAPSATQTIYVNKGGNDSTGDGSFAQPYLTIGVAMASFTSTISSNAYVIMVGPGTYIENVLIKPKVYLVGVPTYLGDGVGITGTLNLDPSWTTFSGVVSAISNLSVSGIITFDFTLSGTSVSTGQFISIYNITTNNTITSIGGALSPGMQFLGSYLPGNINITGSCSLRFINSFCGSTLTATADGNTSVSHPINMSLINSYITHLTSISSSTASPVSIAFANTTIGLSTTITGAGTTTSGFYNIARGCLFTGSPSIVSQNAGSYTPAVSGGVNISAVTAAAGYYDVVGNKVTTYAKFTCTVATTSTTFGFICTLPAGFTNITTPIGLGMCSSTINGLSGVGNFIGSSLTFAGTMLSVAGPTAGVIIGMNFTYFIN